MVSYTMGLSGTLWLLLLDAMRLHRTLGQNSSLKQSLGTQPGPNFAPSLKIANSGK